jgi:DNA (cytosine-5)-methyltransferase 1
MRLDLLAVNHWRVAVDTHARNHPWARHLCADLSTVDPNKAIPGGRLDLLIASPECTHHSIARGGKPCSDQSRASAWHVLHWAERLSPDRILIENVREFEQWGPLNKKGRPIKARRGETFLAFAAALRSLGYSVEWRVLNAADYGDATCRRRLFVQAARRGPLTWPDATHAGRWRPARDIIDWALKGESIFNRRRPLAPRTLDRIEAGLRRFGGEPFIAVLRGTRPDQAGSWAKPLSAPLQTISAGGVHAGLCEPFLVSYHGGQGRQGREARVHGTDQPMPTATTENRYGLCEPFVLPPEGIHRGNAPRSVDDPLPTITAGRGGGCLVEPFLVPMEHSGRQPVRGMDKPLPTITTARGGSFGLCEPFVVQVAHEGADESRVRSVEEPLPTIPAGHRGELAVCEPFLTKYYGTAKGAQPVTEPLDAITTRDRFALVEPGRLDIRFRMLQPHELAAAMGFDGYEFAGTKTDQVRQIGNAVAVRTAEALCGAMIDAGYNKGRNEE